MAADGKLYVNGVDAVTGQYLVPPLVLEEAAALITERAGADRAPRPPIDPRLRRLAEVTLRPHLGLPLDIDPTDLAQAGWAVVFHEAENPAVKKALSPLLEHRSRQAVEANFKVLSYTPGETVGSWLARHNIAAGAVDPTCVPYYVLLVGGPSRFPFTFCHELDVEYAVGVLDFDDPAPYAHYAEAVVRYETGPTPRNSRRAVFFGSRHAGDAATQMTADLLVEPLARGDLARGKPPVTQRCNYASEPIIGAAATKKALTEILMRERDRASLLFTATHGMGWPAEHPRQEVDQGALLCQDWPGVGHVGPPHYFAAGDLPTGASVDGLISFHFACFSVGTPDRDRFYHVPGKLAPPIAARPFMAELPKALLSHPRGGALACIGHVERAWGYSIVMPQAGVQLQPFENAIGAILAGRPVGYAMKDFNERYAALSVRLANTLEQVDAGRRVPADQLAADWVSRNDAEGYVVVGDPAVRLRINDLRG